MILKHNYPNANVITLELSPEELSVIDSALLWLKIDDDHWIQECRNATDELKKHIYDISLERTNLIDAMRKELMK